MEEILCEPGGVFVRVKQSRPAQVQIEDWIWDLLNSSTAHFAAT